MTIQITDVKVINSMIDAMVGKKGFSYPARQNGADKPEGEFAHVRLLEEYPVGIPRSSIKTQTNEETVFRIITPARLRFRIGVVDAEGISSSKIQHGWTSEAVKSIMMKTGYGFIRCTPISTESAKLEKEWEYRQGFSLEVYVTRIYEETVDNINSITLSSEFYDVNKQYLIDLEINNN